MQSHWEKKMPDMGIGTVAMGLGSLAGGALNAFGAQSAGQQGQQYGLMSALLQQQQAQAAEAAISGYVNKNLTPYAQGGQQIFGQLQQQLPQLTQAFQPTMAQLEQTPGYQFTLDQGLQTAQNGYAAAGLGKSGNALAGATQYAEGLASTTYQQQFQNYMAQNLQAYNMLLGGSQLGAQAGAAGASTIGSAYSGITQGLMQGTGNALAGASSAAQKGTLGATQALGTTASNLGGLGAISQQPGYNGGQSLSSYFGLNNPIAASGWSGSQIPAFSSPEMAPLYTIS
jgi:hypothetical protein